MPDVSALSVAMIGALAVVIAAIAGFLGALGGAWVSSRAIAASAKLQQQESRADREEARRLHFDDRIREVSAEILDRANRYLVLVANRRETKGPMADPEVDRAFRRASFELELLVRLPETITALQALENAQYVVYDFDYQLHGEPGGPGWVGPEVADLDEWSIRSDAHEKAMEALKDAVRAELGLDQLHAPEPPPIFRDVDLADD